MTPALSALISQYGYALLAVGCFLEGETVLLAAGFAAHQSLLDWRLVALVAALAGTAGDQFYFALGRHGGGRVLQRLPSLTRHLPRARRLLDRYHAGLIPAIRFMVGLRIAGPLLIGSSGFDPWRFGWLNALGAAAWSALFTGLGYGLGAGAERLVGHLERIEGMLLVGLLGTALVVRVAWRFHCRRRRRRRT
jgi:membrane protein DedA with SNARE-associated domain